MGDMPGLEDSGSFGIGKLAVYVEDGAVGDVGPDEFQHFVMALAHIDVLQPDSSQLAGMSAFDPDHNLALVTYLGRRSLWVRPPT
ncbi:MAG TPA: hypothetical protein VGJ86_19760 [Acidimicrobiales bacterium]|jgi:hypothetical protein